MFTLKQISTIKKALQDKEIEENNIIQPSKKFNHDLILGTARLQEIYKEVCKSEKETSKFLSNRDSPNTTQSKKNNLKNFKKVEKIKETLINNPEELIKGIVKENNILKRRLSNALSKIEEQKLLVQKRTKGRIKKLEGDLKKHALLEETWEKSKEALLKENKSLAAELNKNQAKLKEMKKKMENRNKKKIKQIKTKIEEKGPKGSRKNSIKKINGTDCVKGERDGVRRSASAINFKRDKKSRINVKRQNSEKLRIIRKEALRNDTLFRNYNKKFVSNQRKLQKKLKQSNENLIGVYLKQINELQSKLDNFENKKKSDLREKLSKAFDKFEEEKKKIVVYYKGEKRKLKEKNSILEKNLLEKNSMIQKFQKEFEHKQTKNTHINPTIKNTHNHLYTNFLKEEIFQKIKSNKDKEEEIEFVIEKFIREKQEMEEAFMKKIEDLSHTNIEMKVSHRKKVQCLSQRIKELENNLEHMKSFEQKEREIFGLKPMSTQSDKENSKILLNKSNSMMSSRFPNFGNLKIQLAEKDTVIQILNQKCDILEEENKTQTQKVSLLLERFSEGNTQEFKSLSLKENLNNSVFKENRENRNFLNKGGFENHGFGNNNNNGQGFMGDCGRGKLRYEGGDFREGDWELLKIIKLKDEEIRRLREENQRLSEKLKVIKDNILN